MKNKVRTNEICFNFNLAAINQDFKFLCLERDQGNWFGSPTLDKALQEYPAKAVLFSYGKFAFLQFDAKQNIQKIKHQLQQNEQLNHVKIKVVSAIEEPLATNDINFKPSLYGKWLAQILMNSLISLRASDQTPISNLGGQFYWITKQDAYKVLACKVEINFQGVLTLQAKTFAKQTAGWVDKKPQYTLESGSYFKRVFDQEITNKNMATYIAKELSFKGQVTKASIPFLSINNIEQFKQSKMGIWHQLNQRIEKRLKNYLTLSFKTVDIVHQRALQKSVSLKKRAKDLGCKSILLIDEIKTTQSNTVVKEIQTRLEQQGGLLVNISDKSQANALNIRLVYDREYYRDNQIEDPYTLANQNHAVQHLIMQTWQNNTTKNVQEAILQVCLKEAQLKQELINNQLKTFDWPGFCKKHHIDEPVTFLKLMHPPREERGTFQILPEHISLKKMQIQPNGQINKNTIEDDITALDQAAKQQQAWLQIARDTRTKQNKNNYWLGDLIGMVVIGEQVLGFYNAATKVMPQYQKIGSLLKELEQALPVNWQTPQDWLVNLNKFKQQTNDLMADAQQKAYIDKFETLLTESKIQNFTRQTINTLIAQGLGKTTKAYKLFNNYLIEQNIQLRFSKSKTNLDTHTPGLVKLNIYQQMGALGYSIGIPNGALKQTFEHATPIRWSKSLNNQSIDIEKSSGILADLLDVDFIQAKQSSSAWPFVFGLM